MGGKRVNDRLGPILCSLGGTAAGIAYGLWSVEAAGVLTACLAGAAVAPIVTAILAVVGLLILDITEAID